MFQDYILYGLKLWCLRLVPTLFPFMVLTSVFWSLYDQRKNAAENTFMKFFGKPWGLSPKNMYILLFGLLCGYPSGAASVSKRYKQNQISRNEADYLISICSQSSPAFISAYFIDYILDDKENRFLIFGILYGGIFITSLFTRHIYRNDQEHIRKEPAIFPSSETLFQIFDQSIRNGISTCLLIAGYMILFSGAIGFIINLLHSFSPYHKIIASFMELTYGLSVLKELSIPFQLKEFLLLSLFSFGGICTMAQIKGMFVGTSLSIKPYLIGKSIYTCILWILFKLLI